MHAGTENELTQFDNSSSLWYNYCNQQCLLKDYNVEYINPNMPNSKCLHAS